MQKIIKLTDTHYIVVDDSEIKEGNWVCNIQRPYAKQCQDIDVDYYNRRNDVFKKITHSTQPLYKNDFWAIQELKLSEVKELIGEVDVEKKALEKYPEVYVTEKGCNAPIGTDCYKRDRIAFIQGYNQCLEDNKHKKYTDEDMKRYHNIMCLYGNVKGEEYIQSLQPKTQWEIEIIDGKLKLK